MTIAIILHLLLIPFVWHFWKRIGPKVFLLSLLGWQVVDVLLALAAASIGGYDEVIKLYIMVSGMALVPLGAVFQLWAMRGSAAPSMWTEPVKRRRRRGNSTAD